MKKILSLSLVFVLMLSVLVYAQASTISDCKAKNDSKAVVGSVEQDVAKEPQPDEVNVKALPEKANAAAEPYIVKVYDATDFTDVHSAVVSGGERREISAIVRTHYLMSDGTWRAQKLDGSGPDDKVYNHRFILSSGEAFDCPLVVLTVNLTDMDWYYAYIVGTGLSSDFTESKRFRDEAMVAAMFFGDKTVEYLDMQDQVPAHCIALTHSETGK